MKTIRNIILLAFSITMLSHCNKLDYRRTKSGISYKIFPGKSKDSLLQTGQVVKFDVITRLNDSLLYSSYGRMPAFAKLLGTESPSYNILDVMPMMRKGDSAVAVMMIDTLMKRGVQLPPNAKKGDRIVTTFRVIDAFNSDSLARIDFEKEMAKDRPRQMQEEKEQAQKLAKQRLEEAMKSDQELEKSGEIAKELQDMEAYLGNKKINAQRTGKGTYVEIKEKGNGPAVVAGKFITVKYDGKHLLTDSTFQSSTYTFQIGMGEVIRGWEEGLLLFNQGGKGTLYIPGFLAYGNQQGSMFKPFEPLKFDVEVQNVSDSGPPQQ